MEFLGVIYCYLLIIHLDEFFKILQTLIICLKCMFQIFFYVMPLYLANNVFDVDIFKFFI